MAHQGWAQTAPSPSTLPLLNDISVCVLNADAPVIKGTSREHELALLIKAVLSASPTESLDRMIVAKGGSWRLIETFPVVQIALFLPLPATEAEEVVSAFIQGIGKALASYSWNPPQASLPDQILARLTQEGHLSGKARKSPASLWLSGPIKQSETKLHGALQAAITPDFSQERPGSTDEIIIKEGNPRVVRLLLWSKGDFRSFASAKFLGEKAIRLVGEPYNWTYDIWPIGNQMVLALVASAPLMHLQDLIEASSPLFENPTELATKEQWQEFLPCLSNFTEIESGQLEKGAFLKAWIEHLGLRNPFAPMDNTPEAASQSENSPSQDPTRNDTPSMAFSGYTPHRGDTAPNNTSRDDQSFSPPDIGETIVCFPNRNMGTFMCEDSGNPVIAVTRAPNPENSMGVTVSIQWENALLETIRSRAQEAPLFQVGGWQVVSGGPDTLLFRLQKRNLDIGHEIALFRSWLLTEIAHFPESTMTPDNPSKERPGTEAKAPALEVPPKPPLPMPTIVISIASPQAPFEILGKIRQEWLAIPQTFKSASLDLKSLAEVLYDQAREMPITPPTMAMLKGQWLRKTATISGLSEIVARLIIKGFRFGTPQEILALLQGH